VTTAVRLRRLTRHVGETVAVDRVDLDVAPGDALLIVGAGSSGRRMLLQMMATLVRPSSGSLEIGGVDAIRDPLAARAQVAYAGTPAVTGAGLTVREYLQFMMESPRGRRSRRSTSVAQALDRLALAGDADVDTLSPAQRQRLGIGVVLMLRPPVAVLDDLPAGADPETYASVGAWITEVCSEGMSVIAGVDADAESIPWASAVRRIENGGLLDAVIPFVSRPPGRTAAGVL